MESKCSLSQKKCVPCKRGSAPLQGKEILKLYEQLDKKWMVVGEHHLEAEYVFKTFKEALIFTNKVGELAEQEGHHPDIYLSYGRVKIQLWTHKIDGLSESDFILAAKCDAIE